MNGKNFNNSKIKINKMVEILEYIEDNKFEEINYQNIVKINFLRNFTIEAIEPFIKYHSINNGLKANVQFGAYNMVRQEVFDTSSHLYNNTPDIIVVALYLETYLADRWTIGWTATEVFDELKGLYFDLTQKTDAIIAINTFIPPFYYNSSISIDESPSRIFEMEILNQQVRKFVNENSSRFVLIDWERMIRLLGEQDSMDYRFWFMSKAPFKKNFLDLYAYELSKVALALKGKTKKCLILDCDNTLWGGVIGEDGITGIKLDKFSYPGNIFYEFQLSVLRLHKHGVLIALCSKNNESDILEVLDLHSQCCIKREHISALRVNWNDKATNIRELADELNLGLDSFVFIDDNILECDLIRELVPEVTVIQVPSKLFSYPQILEKDGLFDKLSSSKEDKLRSSMYREEANRRIEKNKFDNIDEYLHSLSISIDVHKMSAEEIPRIAQLTQKTNQFNLTTRRYTESQIKSFMNNPDFMVLSLSVQDKFGDSGITGVLIANYNDGIVIIDTLLLSCRILGRNIETAFVVNAINIIDLVWNVKAWEAEFIVSKKNQQVKDFWLKVGFELQNQNDFTKKYKLFNIDSLTELPLYIITK